VTDPQLRRWVVYHGLELYYVYGVLPEIDALPDSVVLGTQMMDYWISFATSLDPNDGFGIPRAIRGYNLFSKIVLNAIYSAGPFWQAYTAENAVWSFLLLSSCTYTAFADVNPVSCR
jgi:hypothetical protein